MAVIIMVMIEICSCTWSSIQVITGCSMSDTGLSQSLLGVTCNEAGPLSTSVTWFLFLKIMAEVERDMPDSKQ